MSMSNKENLTPNEVKNRLDKLANVINDVYEELNGLKAYFEKDYDKEEIRNITTDLSWATENLTTLGLHQIGESLDDKFGR